MGCGLLFRIPDFLALLISILFRKTSEMLEEFHFFFGLVFLLSNLLYYLCSGFS